MSLYWIGVMLAIVLGWLAILDIKDKECNLTIPECSLISVPLLALFSWLTVILIILVEFRKRILRINDVES